MEKGNGRLGKGRRVLKIVFGNGNGIEREKCISEFVFSSLSKLFRSQIVSHKLEWKGESRVGSLENATHKAGGGNVKVREAMITTRNHPNPIALFAPHEHNYIFLDS